MSSQRISILNSFILRDKMLFMVEYRLNFHYAMFIFFNLMFVATRCSQVMNILTSFDSKTKESIKCIQNMPITFTYNAFFAYQVLYR